MATIKGADRGGYLGQRQLIDSLYARAMRVLRGQENDSVDKLMKAYGRAQDDIVARMATHFAGQKDQTLQEWVDSGRLRSMLGSIDQVIEELGATTNRQITRGSTVQFLASYDQTAYTLDQATPPTVPVTFTRPPTDAIKLLVNTPYKGAMFSQRIGIITNAMAADIRTALTQSLIQGEGIDQAAARIEKIIGISGKKAPEAYANRARVIARTEIMRAQNMARDFAYEQNKDLLEDGETEWMVAPDDRLCEWCLRREGLSDAEIEDSDPGEDPWGNDTDCPLHPNCRCTKAPRLKSWKSLIGLDMPEQLKDSDRGIRDESGRWTIVKPDSFKEWLEKRGATQDQYPEF